MSITAPAMMADSSPFAQFDDHSIAEAPLNGWHSGPRSFATAADLESTPMTSPWLGRLAFDPAVSGSSPVVIGTYVTTRHVASLVVDGWSWAEIRAAHPGLDDDDIRACLAYAIEEESPDLD